MVVSWLVLPYLPYSTFHAGTVQQGTVAKDDLGKTESRSNLVSHASVPTKVVYIAGANSGAERAVYRSRTPAEEGVAAFVICDRGGQDVTCSELDSTVLHSISDCREI